VKLNLRFSVPAAKESLADDLRELFLRGACCDTVLVCAERTFPAHRTALAARSAVFREEFAVQSQAVKAQEPAPPQSSESGAGSAASSSREFRISAASNPEAVQHLLNYIYEIPPAEEASIEIVKDVLRLADVYKLPGLAQRATQWLSKDVTTGDVVERLAVCRDFGLAGLRQKFLEVLHNNKTALGEVVRSSKVLEYPELMQELLQQVAGPQNDEDEPCTPSKKRAKKGGKGKGKGRGGH